MRDVWQEEHGMADTRGRNVFVNVAVRDVEKSTDFFSRLGFRFKPKFTDDKARTWSPTTRRSSCC